MCFKLMISFSFFFLTFDSKPRVKFEIHTYIETSLIFILLSAANQLKFKCLPLPTLEKEMATHCSILA